MLGLGFGLGFGSGWKRAAGYHRRGEGEDGVVGGRVEELGFDEVDWAGTGIGDVHVGNGRIGCW